MTKSFKDEPILLSLEEWVFVFTWKTFYYGASHLRLEFNKLSGESNMSQAKALNLKEITNIIKEHKEELKEKYGIKEIGIFGSYVREETQRKEGRINREGNLCSS